jgi:hypothetical protein
MSTQPEALRLADVICDYSRYGNESEQVAKLRRMKANAEAAAELRRLYWDELRVREHRDMLATGTTKLHAEIKQLQEQRDELLAALKKVSLTAVYVGNGESSLAFDVVKEVDAAIAKAEGKS